MIKLNLSKNRKKNPYKCGGLTIKLVETDDELLDAKWIRMNVFQKEQGISASTDFDGNDKEAAHIVAYLKEMPAGTARIRLLGSGAAKIERMAVLREFRKRGIGSQVVKYALHILKKERIKIVRLSSQEQVKDFYKQFGFSEVGGVFDEAGIRHIMMEKRL